MRKILTNLHEKALLLLLSTKRELSIWCKSVINAKNKISDDNRTLYFILVVLLFGCMGVWLPFVIDIYFSKKNYILSTPINLATAFIALSAGSMFDLMIKTIYDVRDKSTNKPINTFLWLAVKVVFLFSLGFISVLFCQNYDENKGGDLLRIAYVCAIIGQLFSFYIWYEANDKKKFAEPDFVESFVENISDLKNTPLPE